jgi:hypothetical protein
MAEIEFLICSAMNRGKIMSISVTKKKGQDPKCSVAFVVCFSRSRSPGTDPYNALAWYGQSS